VVGEDLRDAYLGRLIDLLQVALAFRFYCLDVVSFLMPEHRLR
jgi:hypothetical protein